MSIEFKDPPPSETTRLRDEADKALRSRPGEWAKIASTQGVDVCPWWSYFFDRSEYETRVVYETTRMFGPRDIYARYVR